MSGADDWNEIHRRANEGGAPFYIDPQSGYRVFTETGLRKRGSCCGNGCRHCPWQHVAMTLPDRIARSRQPSWLTAEGAPAEPVDLLFWSGGKDSLLALRALKREGARPVVLLTTFDAERRMIAHQDIVIDDAVRQARRLGLPLLGVPMHQTQRYDLRIREACALVPQIRRLVFGDLHLEQIRAWREVALLPLAEDLGAELHFPLWGASMEALVADLEASGVRCVISAVTEAAEGAVQVGEIFDRALMARLPMGVDPFGERGEFHTLVQMW